MHNLIKVTVACMLMILTLHARSELVVIVNADNPIDNLSKREIIDLYMGRNLYFPSGDLALRLDLAPDSPERITFYQKMVKKSVAQVNAYWARLSFGGRASPPTTAPNSRKMLETVRLNKYALGYIDAQDLDDSVKVVGHVN